MVGSGRLVDTHKTVTNSMKFLSIESDKRAVATITFNRPEAFNAMNRQFMDELLAALQELSGTVRVLVLAANGKHFCAGADVNWMRDSSKLTEQENQDDAHALADMLFALNTFPSPTIAKIQGVALGGGTGIVSCCDIAVAAEDARFALSEARLGLIPATISPYVLEAIGARAARRYFLTAEQFAAAQALRAGLIHEICTYDELADRIEQIIEGCLLSGPKAQTAAKQLIADVTGAKNDAALRQQLASRLASIRAGQEAQEGLGAFLEKRKPSWAPR